GDFHLGNVMFSRASPDVVAIVDWEMCTLGDPLLDLGWMLATCPGCGPREILAVSPADGFPRPDELVDRYARQSGRSLRDIDWYQVLANYKLGIVLEGTYARACAGQAPKETGDLLHKAARGLIRNAETIIEGA